MRAIADETGIEVIDLASLRRAMESIFARHAPCAIAVKSQHAYRRTLDWSERSAAAAAAALEGVLRRPPADVGVSTNPCLGDWCWARGVELAIEHNLPFKIHTGYYAGNDRMPVRRIPAGNMCALFARYPDARFVLMHIAYPYSGELAALAKHYRNIWVDLCWAWSIDPYSARDFVRRFIHTGTDQQAVRLRGRHRLADQRAGLRDTGAPRHSPRAGSGDRRRGSDGAAGNGYCNQHHAHQSVRLLRPGGHPDQHPRRGIARCPARPPTIYQGLEASISHLTMPDTVSAPPQVKIMNRRLSSRSG